MTQKNTKKTTGCLESEPSLHTVFGLSFTEYGKHTEVSTWRPLEFSHNPKGTQRSARNKSEMTDATKAAALSRARKTIRQKIMAMGADRMLTLTYRDPMIDQDKLWSDWTKLVRKLKTIKADFPYVAVPEQHKSGGLHLHIAIKGFINISAVREAWYLLTARADGQTGGQVNITATNHKNKKTSFQIAQYVGKYLTKTKDFIEISRNRYRCSLGIKINKHVMYLLSKGDNTTINYKDYIVNTVEKYLGITITGETEYRHNLYWLTTWGLNKIQEPEYMTFEDDTDDYPVLELVT